MSRFGPTLDFPILTNRDDLFSSLSPSRLMKVKNTFGRPTFLSIDNTMPNHPLHSIKENIVGEIINTNVLGCFRQFVSDICDSCLVPPSTSGKIL